MLDKKRKRNYEVELKKMVLTKKLNNKEQARLEWLKSISHSPASY